MKIAQALGLLLAALATQAGANTVYSYQGENYDFLSGDNPNIPGSYTTDMSVVIRFELAAPIAPNTTIAELTKVLSYSFSDARFVKTTQSPDDFVRFNIGTDASGVPNEWAIGGQFWNGPLNTIGTSINNIQSINNPSTVGFIDVVVVGVCTALSANDNSCIFNDSEDARNGNVVGNWTVTPNPVPVPAAVWLLGSALGGLLGLTRHRAPKLH